MSIEPSRIAGPFYRISARHLFSVIGHITASAFERLRISALLVQILALFPRDDMGQIVEPTGTYRSYSFSEVRNADPGMTFGKNQSLEKDGKSPAAPYHPHKTEK